MDNSVSLFPSPLTASPPTVSSELAQMYRMNHTILPETGSLSEVSGTPTRPLSRVNEQCAATTDSSNGAVLNTRALSSRSSTDDETGSSRKLRELLTRPTSSRAPPSSTPSLPPQTPGSQNAIPSEPDRLNCLTPLQQQQQQPQQLQQQQQQSLQQQSLPQLLQQQSLPLLQNPLPSPVIKREPSEFKFPVPNSSPSSTIYSAQTIERKSFATACFPVAGLSALVQEHTAGVDRPIASAKVSAPAPTHARVGHPSAPAAAQLTLALTTPQLPLPLLTQSPLIATPHAQRASASAAEPGDSILKSLLSQDDDTADLYALSHSSRSSLQSSSRHSLLSRASSFVSLRSPEPHIAPPETASLSVVAAAANRTPPVASSAGAVTCTEGRPPSNKRRNTSLSNLQATTAAAPVPVSGSSGADMKQPISAFAVSSAVSRGAIAARVGSTASSATACQVLDPSIEPTPLMQQLQQLQQLQQQQQQQQQQQANRAAPLPAAAAPAPVSKPTASVAPFQRLLTSSDAGVLGASPLLVPVGHGGFSFAPGVGGGPVFAQPEPLKFEPNEQLLFKLLHDEQLDSQALFAPSKLEPPSSIPMLVALEPLTSVSMSMSMSATGPLVAGALMPMPGEQPLAATAGGQLLDLLQRNPAEQTQLLQEWQANSAAAAAAGAGAGGAPAPASADASAVERARAASGSSEQCKSARDRRRSSGGNGAAKRRHSQAQRPDACEPSAQQQQSEATASNELPTSPVSARSATPVARASRRAGDGHNGSPRRTSACSGAPNMTPAPPSQLVTQQPMLELEYIAQYGAEVGVLQAASPFSGAASPRSHQQQQQLMPMPPASSPNSSSAGATTACASTRGLLKERLLQRTMHSNTAISPGSQQMGSPPPPMPPPQLLPGGTRYERQPSLCASASVTASASENLVSSSTSDMGLVSTTCQLPESAPQPALAAEKTPHRSGSKRSSRSAAESGASAAQAAASAGYAGASEQQSAAATQPLASQQQQPTPAPPPALVRSRLH